MQRASFIHGISAAVAAAPLIEGRTIAASGIAGVPIPDTPLAKEAAALAISAQPIQIYRHSLRTYLFAELVAKAQKIDHDVEAVYVAAILHDMGLVPKYMSERQRFEVDGANLARDLLKKHGVVGTRADLIWDAVSLHDQSGIARWKQPEVMLVSAGVGADFGAYADVLAKDDVVAVLRAAPRSDFIAVFLDAVAAFVKKKPYATGNSWVTDVGYKMVPGFHLDNFVDEVKEDPFATYGAFGSPNGFPSKMGRRNAAN